MDNLEKSFKEFLKFKSDFKPRPWQKKALLNTKIWLEEKVLLAAGTGSGKTFFTIAWLCMKYLMPENKDKITFIVPSGQTNLRKNFKKSLKDFGKTSFSYCVAESRQELIDAINNKCQVIVALPHAIRDVKDLPKIDTFILDEAHTWYFAKTIKDIIKRTKPTRRLLLTGTPAPFILRGGFHMHFVPVMEVYDEGFISNTEIHVISSSYNFKESDFTYSDELSLHAANRDSLSSEESFRKVILGMIRKLKNPIKGTKNLNRLTNEIGGKFFNHLDKTIIWAADIKQANKFTEILRTFQGLENGVLVSHSKNDKFSDHLDEFKKNDAIRVLVCVDRTRLGWDYTELFHGIDFTMSRNLNTIQQMMARLFRISKLQPDKTKYFFKVSNAKDAGYYTVIMKGVFLLLDREWMSKYNGRNFNGMEIPVTVPRRKVINPDGSKVPGRKRTNHKYEMLDLPLDMNFFRTVYAKQDDIFSTVAWTNVGRIRNELLGIQQTSYVNTPEKLIKECKQVKMYNDITSNNEYWIVKAREFNVEKEAFGHMPDWAAPHNYEAKNKQYFIDYLSQYKGKATCIDGLLKFKDCGSFYSAKWHAQKALELGVDVYELMGFRKQLEDRMNREKVIEIAKKSTSLNNMQHIDHAALTYARKYNMQKELEQYYMKTVYKELTTGTEGSLEELADKFNMKKTYITGRVNSKEYSGVITKGKWQGLHFIKEEITQ